MCLVNPNVAILIGTCSCNIPVSHNKRDLINKVDLQNQSTKTNGCSYPPIVIGKSDVILQTEDCEFCVLTVSDHNLMLMALYNSAYKHRFWLTKQQQLDGKLLPDVVHRV